MNSSASQSFSIQMSCIGLLKSEEPLPKDFQPSFFALSGTPAEMMRSAAINVANIIAKMTHPNDHEQYVAMLTELVNGAPVSAPLKAAA